MASIRQSYVFLLVVAGAFTMLSFEHIVLPYFSYKVVENSGSVASMSQGTPVDVANDNSGTKSLRSAPSPGKTLVYRFNGSEMQQLYEFCTWTVHVDCVSLKTTSGETPIHIHDIVIDKYVSKTIKVTGSWEPVNVNLILTELKKDPELGFMDLGSHVGAFSLSVAKFGRKVISVDPLIENVKRLCKSIQKGGFTDRMTIIFNPLGFNHSFVNFKREFGNVGGTSVVASSGSSTKSPCEEPADSYTITLDDTLPFLPFKKAVLKMDIQEFEYYVLSGAKRFFQEIEVPAILMEWVLMKTDVNGEKLVKLLVGMKYSAYAPSIGGAKLDPSQYKSWPYDVIWKK
ncbi:uncharacterized protein LOC124284696 [Haliotis rubra]|uniref:uncharacterized protein LOC124284696 n=1 Tax=Haliotis rubra TaxID=36100 RepID=UPI001EE50D37|nr:uncharacterized protein LOC124284696 [Haliotis rubra]XP_046576756.1 uncharacterized protein LOC124284696 [Haliotis rubra]XP_046576757.1 uncharacterized protein LOC124284696 [Haliotis rubra]XP_046576758.1 uncharacterized protein LOC124284696 [Haliotis rubra]